MVSQNERQQHGVKHNGDAIMKDVCILGFIPHEKHMQECGEDEA